MRSAHALLVGIGIAALAATSAIAQQPRSTTTKTAAPASGGATIYFFRGTGIKGPWTPHVVADGHDIGGLDPNTVLIFRRPSGHLGILVPGVALSGDVHSEIDVTAGQTYYLEYGPYADAPGMQLVMSLMAGGAGVRGKMLPGSGFNNSFRFYQLDNALGRELVAKAKSAAH